MLTVFASSCSSGSKVSTTKGTTNPVPLFGTKWMIENIGGKRILTPEGGNEIYIIISEKEGAVGSSGCNTFRGKADASGSSLKLGPMATTRMMCEGLMETESSFLSALDKTASYSISANKLSLKDASGKVLATFNGFKTTGAPGEN